MIKKCALLLILLFSYNTVSALQLCSPSQEYIDYMNLPDEERINYQEPIYCSSIFNKKMSVFPSGNSINQIVLGEQKSMSSSFYNAYDEGIVNRSGHQQGTGLCWDFSALSVVETNAMKNRVGNYDFSEAHLAYTLLAELYSDANGQKNKYKFGTTGGKVTFAPTYFFNNGGQLLEENMPFSSNLTPSRVLKTINSSAYTSGNDYITVESFQIDNIDDIGRCTIDEINTIKSSVIKYGSVQASMYMDEGLFSDVSNNYYLSTSSNAIGENHGVVIVGWDDSVPKELFHGATRDGAWIVKNSWGSNWSSDGLFYVSYDDHFICKVVVSFNGVSNKSFDYTYKSADLVGNLTLGLTGDFYMASKFTKQSIGSETIDRVTFPTAFDTSYNVYLVKDSNLNNKNNWVLLKHGISSTYGLDSVNLEGIEVDDDFMIVVSYSFPDGDISSLLMMCDSIEDYNEIDISTETNYYSTNGNNWHDMSSIPMMTSETIGCEPNIYVYTNSVNNIPRLEINSITNIDDNITLTITKKNISDIVYKILDNNNVDVTSHFTITPHFDNSSIEVVSDNTVSGDFNVVLNGNNINTTNTFSLIEDIKSINNKVVIDSNKITITIGKGKTLTYKDIYDSLKLKNTGIRIIDSKGNTISNNTAPVGTKNALNTNNNSYNVIVKGDPTGDGKISALDYIAIRKHIIKSSIITDPIIKDAADMDNNNKISALDYIAIRKIMIGG